MVFNCIISADVMQRGESLNFYFHAREPVGKVSYPDFVRAGTFWSGGSQRLPDAEELFAKSLLKNPKQTAESMILLVNVWFSPLIFSDTKEDYMKKYEQLKLIYEGIGLPVFDDELQSWFENLYDQIAARQ